LQPTEVACVGIENLGLEGANLKCDGAKLRKNT
jgi:hypothetical protein